MLAACFPRHEALMILSGALAALPRLWGPHRPHDAPGWLLLVAEDAWGCSALGVAAAEFVPPHLTGSDWEWRFSRPLRLDDPIPYRLVPPFVLGLDLVGEDLRAELSLLLGVG